MSAYNLLKAAALDAEGAEEDSLRPLTTREEKKLLGPLLRLRQACCHPQASPQPPQPTQSPSRCCNSL